MCYSRSTYTKIGTIQRRLAWPLRKDDTQIREAFQIFSFVVMSLTPLGLTDLFLTISVQNSEELGLEDRSSRRGKMRSATNVNTRLCAKPR